MVHDRCPCCLPGLHAGFVPARKARDKLPRETRSESYELEYGSDSLEMHLDAIDENDIVLVVDDLIATGGTAAAQARLVSKAGAKVEGFAFLLELAFLNPREVLAQSSTAEVYSLISVD